MFEANWLIGPRWDDSLTSDRLDWLDAVPIREKLSRCFSVQSLKVQQFWNLNPTFCRWWLESTDLKLASVHAHTHTHVP